MTEQGAEPDQNPEVGELDQDQEAGPEVETLLRDTAALV